MTNQIVIHFPHQTIIIDSDESDKIAKVSEFCDTELHSYHASEDANEFTVDNLTEEMYSKFYFLTAELGLNIS